MTKLPRLTGKKVIKALQKAGFEAVRIKGSHHFLRHADGSTRDARAGLDVKDSP